MFPENLAWDEVVSIEEVDDDTCYDITILEDDVYLNEPNFIAEGIVVHNCQMDVRYCKRKKGEEPYNVHPVMKPILDVTYGVMCYQEQVMDILRVVGNIPDMHTEKVRKAISKKKVKEFEKYKEQFIDNGQINLNANAENVIELWDQIVSFAEYGFNKCMTIRTLVNSANGPKEIQDFVPGDVVYCVNTEGKIVETEVVNLHDHGEIEGFEVTFDDGYKVTCSANHKFLTEKGQMSLREICRTRSFVLCDQQYRGSYAKEERRGLEVAMWDRVSKQEAMARASDGVSKLQGERAGIKARKISNYSTLRNQSVDQRQAVRTSSQLQSMQTTGLEKVFGIAYCEMRDGISNMEGERKAFTELSSVRGYQERQYQGTNGEVERRESCARSQEDIFGHGSQNVSQTRDNSGSCQEFEEMARGESREISGNNSIGKCFTKEIQNGKLGEGAIGVEVREDSVWGGSKASRFGGGEYLDRSGRVLSFLRASKQQARESTFTESSGKGFDVERGVFEQGGCDADSSFDGVFCEFDRGMQVGCLELGAGHAEITDTGGLVRRKVVRVVSVGKQRMYDLEVSNPTHNFLLPNGIVTSNSHAYAYSYISARLLCLKAHYPLEFYTATLMCEGDTEKMKDYKLDAQYHGVEVCPVHINKSRANFHIEDAKIYFGFSNMNHIGDGVATRIEQNQPYRNFPDFLERFGSDAKAVKALVSLGTFEDTEDRVLLRKFSEYYKERSAYYKDKQRKFESSMDTRIKELKDLLLTEVSESDPDFEKMNDFTEEAEALWNLRFAGITRKVPYKYKGENRVREVAFTKQLFDLVKKRKTTIENNLDKMQEMEDGPITLDKFDPSDIELDPEEIQILEDELILNGKKTYPKAERIYYGFQWTHRLETCPEYKGMTIDKFLDACENDGVTCAAIEVEILNVNHRVSKRGVKFYSVEVEDANGKVMFVNIWNDDFTRFEDWLKAGNLVAMRVKPPGGGFNTLTFESVERHKRKYLGPKEEDYRLILMHAPEVAKPDHSKGKVDESVLDDMIFFDPNSFVELPTGKFNPEEIPEMDVKKPAKKADRLGLEVENFFND